MILNKDFREFIELLNKNDVMYLIVGGYALAFHGHPRYTKDIDIWILIDKKNAECIVQVLKDFGFASLGLIPDDFLLPEYIIQLGNPPNRIDLLTSIDGVNFLECFQSKLVADIEGLKINFINIENLKKNKRASGRHQDLADLEKLS